MEEQRYFEWLCERAGMLEYMDKFSALLSIMMDCGFYPIEKSDENRWEDGVHLRVEFADDISANSNEADHICEQLDRVLGGCTMLELVVTLAERICYELVGSPFDKDISEWTMEILANAGLLNYTNEIMSEDEEAYYMVSDILERIVFRRYHANGEGGFFPLNDSKCQRDRELLDQLNSYISENYNLLN